MPGESLLPMNSVANLSVMNVSLNAAWFVCLCLTGLVTNCCTNVKALTFVRQLVTSPVRHRQLASIIDLLVLLCRGSSGSVVRAYDYWKVPGSIPRWIHADFSFSLSKAYIKCNIVFLGSNGP